jgi:hypothetical protein
MKAFSTSEPNYPKRVSHPTDILMTDHLQTIDYVAMCGITLHVGIQREDRGSFGNDINSQTGFRVVVSSSLTKRIHGTPSPPARA